MTSARDQILGGIRKSLKRGTLAPERARELDRRLANHPQGIVPRRSRGLDHGGLVQLFETQATDVATTVERVTSLADLPRAIAGYLSRHNLPAMITASPDPLLDRVPWAERPLLKVKRGTPDPRDQTGVSVGFCAIAETGTLMMVSGPDNPSTLNFLPDDHIVVVPVGRVVGPMEEAWRRLRDSRGGQAAGPSMPRTVNFITGPSRTGDIEQKLEMGAHGPRRQHILLVEDESLA
jgi:L-lactate dehydrogenase complex protein LldG